MPPSALRPIAAFAPLAVLLSALAFVAACTGRDAPEQVLYRMGDGVHDLFLGHRNAKDELIVFESPGIVAVDVENFAGDVIIKADPRAEGIVVRVARESLHGFLRGREGKASLADVTATAELVPGSLGPVLEVRTHTAHEEDHYQRAHLWIDAPAIDGVRVRTGRGKVHAIGIEGAVDIESGRGDVRVITDLPMTRSVTVVSREGDIDFRVTGESGGTIDAETVNGRVLVRCTDAHWRATGPGTTVDRMLAVFNDGENRIALRTTEGDIRVAVVPNPTLVGPLIVEP